MQPKRGWKVITDERIVTIYHEAMDEARANGLWSGANPPLYSHKSYKTLGSCYWKKVGSTYDTAIVLSEYLLGEPEKMRNTIVHEVGHATAPADHHGAKWRHNTNLIGKKWGLTAERLNSDKELSSLLKDARPQNDYKYELYCPHCGTTWRYKTNCEAIRRPSRYRCGKCKLALKSRAI